MKDSARYVKIVEWSDKDNCYIGSAPGTNGPCSMNYARSSKRPLNSTARTGSRFRLPLQAETSPTRCRMSRKAGR